MLNLPPDLQITKYNIGVLENCVNCGIDFNLFCKTGSYTSTLPFELALFTCPLFNQATVDD